jgi:hypothetical protein
MLHDALRVKPQRLGPKVREPWLVEMTTLADVGE